MAELHDLSPTPGSRKTKKRVGRGPGSGKGKTAGRGHNGAKSRAGASRNASFEGGQMPLQRRLPKRGFHNLFRTEYQVVNVMDLAVLEGKVDPSSLREAGLIRSLRHPVKILGKGEVARGLEVMAHAFSASAREKIEAAGGSARLVGTEEQA